MPSDAHQPPLGGVMPHVGAARLVRGNGAQVDGFSRGVGRNRIAVAVDVPLSPGERVSFDVAIDGGHMAGDGRVERIHAQPLPDGGAERWIVLDVDRLSSESTARLVRMLLHDTLVIDEEPVPAWRSQLRLREPRLRPAPPPERKRVRVRRPSVPELPDRWRVRPAGSDD